MSDDHYLHQHYVGPDRDEAARQARAMEMPIPENLKSLYKGLTEGKIMIGTWADSVMRELIERIAKAEHERDSMTTLMAEHRDGAIALQVVIDEQSQQIQAQQEEIERLKLDLSRAIFDTRLAAENATLQATVTRLEMRLEQRDRQIAAFNSGGFADADAMAEKYLDVLATNKRLVESSPLDFECPHCLSGPGKRCFEKQFGVYEHTFHNSRIAASRTDQESKPSTKGNQS